MGDFKPETEVLDVLRDCYLSVGMLPEVVDARMARLEKGEQSVFVDYKLGEQILDLRRAKEEYLG